MLTRRLCWSFALVKEKGRLRWLEIRSKWIGGGRQGVWYGLVLRLRQGTRRRVREVFEKQRWKNVKVN
jgi:hypothetical protein